MYDFLTSSLARSARSRSSALPLTAFGALGERQALNIRAFNTRSRRVGYGPGQPGITLLASASLAAYWPDMSCAVQPLGGRRHPPVAIELPTTALF